MKNPISLIRNAIIGFVVAVGVLSSFHVTSAGHVGVVKVFGEVQPKVLPEGLHFMNPLATVTDVDVRLAKTVEKSEAGTRDMQSVNTEITVNYRLVGEKANVIYKDYGLNIVDSLINPSIKESFKAVVANYTSEELITKRQEVSSRIRTTLENKVSKYGVGINEISITGFRFSPAYSKAIEDKVTAQQRKLKAEQDLERIIIEGKQKVATAEAEAESLKAQKNQITPELLQLRAIEAQREAIAKWDGRLPTFTGSEGVPFIQVTK